MEASSAARDRGSTGSEITQNSPRNRASRALRAYSSTSPRLASNWAMRTSFTPLPTAGMPLDATNRNASQSKSISWDTISTGGMALYCHGSVT